MELRNISIGHVYTNEVAISDDNGAEVTYTFFDKEKAERFSKIKNIENAQEGEDIGAIAGDKEDVKDIKMRIPPTMSLTEALQTYVPEGTETVGIKRYDPKENRTYDFDFSANSGLFHIKKDGKEITDDINFDTLLDTSSENRGKDRTDDAMKIREFVQALSSQKKITIDTSIANNFLEKLTKDKYTMAYDPVVSTDEKCFVNNVVRNDRNVEVTLTDFDRTDGALTLGENSVTIAMSDVDASSDTLNFLMQTHNADSGMTARYANFINQDAKIDFVAVNCENFAKGLDIVNSINSFRTEPISFEIKTEHGDGVNYAYDNDTKTYRTEYKGETLEYVQGEAVYADVESYPETLSSTMVDYVETLYNQDNQFMKIDEDDLLTVRSQVPEKPEYMKALDSQENDIDLT
jgi:hypothetical protein